MGGEASVFGTVDPIEPRVIECIGRAGLLNAAMAVDEWIVEDGLRETCLYLV